MRLTISDFSRWSDYRCCPVARRLPVLSGFSFRLRPSTCYSVSTRPCHSQVITSRRRNLDRLVIGCPSRVPLSPRLTLRRLTLLRKPWVFGVNISIFIVVTYAYIFVSSRSSMPHGTPSRLTGMLPYRCICMHPTASAAVLMPVHHPRVTARLVSCYALFE